MTLADWIASSSHLYFAISNRSSCIRRGVIEEYHVVFERVVLNRASFYQRHSNLSGIQFKSMPWNSSFVREERMMPE